MGLADQQFFLSLELTKFAMKVAVSLRRDQSVTTTLYQGKVRDWLVGKDKDCVLSKLCCSLARCCHLQTRLGWLLVRPVCQLA